MSASLVYRAVAGSAVVYAISLYYGVFAAIIAVAIVAVALAWLMGRPQAVIPVIAAGVTMYALSFFIEAFVAMVLAAILIPVVLAGLPKVAPRVNALT